eukprot:jgi/Ulvmu1/2204/UM013_0050.1
MRWPSDLQRAELAEARCGDVHEAFLRVQEDAERSTPRRPWRPRSAAAGGAGAGLGGLAESRGPTLRVTLQPVPRPWPGPDMLAATVHNSRTWARTCLPAGFGSGWDNYRGRPGETRMRTARSDAQHDTAARRDAFFSAVRRQPAEACRVPDTPHTALLSTRTAGSGADPSQHCTTAALLQRSRASVLAFSPCGTLLAAALEEALQHWHLRVFDVATGALMPPGSVAAHKALVYGLCWSGDGRVIASCSSDCTAKVWYLDAAADHAASTRRLASPTLPFCTVLHHPSYVYSCQAHPSTQIPTPGLSASAGMLLLVTGCADGMLRFWGIRGDTDAGAEPDGTSPLLQLVAGTRPGSAMLPAAVGAALWDAPAEQEAMLTTTTMVATGTTSGSTRLPAPTTAPAAAPRDTAAVNSAPMLFTGDDSGGMASWVVDASEVCRGAKGAVQRIASASVGAAVTCLSTAAHTVKLAVMTKASRIVVLHKRTLQTVMTLEGVPTGGLPGKAAMDPGRGRWLLVGAADGRLYCFSLSPPGPGAAAAVMPCMQADVAPGAAAGRGPPVYCVAWSPTMHVAAVGSRHPAGYSTLLCSRAGSTTQRHITLFKPCTLRHSQRHGTRTPQRASAGARPRSAPQAPVAQHSAVRYRLPEEVDSLYVKTLLCRIRGDLHARGLLDTADAPLTRYAGVPAVTN